MSAGRLNLSAVLKSPDTIEVAVYKSYTAAPIEEFKLYEDNRYRQTLKVLSKSESKSSFIYTLSVDCRFEVGRDYAVADDRLEIGPLDIEILSKSAEFEKKFRYDGELGAVYGPDKTVFRLFSPLATACFVNLRPKSGQPIFGPMQRLECGVYEAEVAGDLDEAAYTFVARINGVFREAPDPYAKALGANSCPSFVVNPAKIKARAAERTDRRPVLKRRTEAVIYELSVRDMTSRTALPDKGRFSALSRTGLTDGSGFPLGLDYIRSLGVNYVQLLPIYDFQTVDEEHPFTTYNWGYDPKFFFAPEGGYSSLPGDPYRRLYELKDLVAAFHESGIGVVMDVVFNHVFNASSNALDVLCPGYYFRLGSDGGRSNGSGCGNDFESRNYMARKLIVDCLRYFVEVYGIDGFRFDLMGIIDVDTLLLAHRELSALRPGLLFYGEGWDMATNLPGEQKGSMYNAGRLKPIGFFNDRFRDIAKGKTSDSELSFKGYLSGDINYIDGFKNVLLGSSVALAFPPLFDNPDQSVNYVECHDNSTLFDKLKACCPNESPEELLKRVKLINAVVIFAAGIPFLHAGQEYGASKKGVSNSYTAGDEINGFDYKLAAQRKDMINFLRDAIELRKSLPFFNTDSKKELLEHVSFQNLEGGALAVVYRFESDEYYLLINPTDKTVSYQFDRYVKVIFNEAGRLDDFRYSQLIMVNGRSLTLVKINRS